MIKWLKNVRPILWRGQDHWWTIAGFSTPTFTLTVTLQPTPQKPKAEPFAGWRAF